MIFVKFNPGWVDDFRKDLEKYDVELIKNYRNRTILKILGKKIQVYTNYCTLSVYEDKRFIKKIDGGFELDIEKLIEYVDSVNKKKRTWENQRSVVEFKQTFVEIDLLNKFEELLPNAKIEIKNNLHTSSKSMIIRITFNEEFWFQLYYQTTESFNKLQNTNIENKKFYGTWAYRDTTLTHYPIYIGLTNATTFCTKLKKYFEYFSSEFFKRDYEKFLKLIENRKLREEIVLNDLRTSTYRPQMFDILDKTDDEIKFLNNLKI